MKAKPATVFFILLLTALTVFPQQQQQQQREAEKIDDFEATSCDDYRGRLDRLLVSVNNSSGAKGYVIVYPGNLKQFIYDRNWKNKGIKYVKPAANYARELIGYFKSHLRLRRFPAERIVFIEGGFREEFTIEFWLVPKDAAPPTPTPTLKKIKQAKPGKYAEGFCGGL
ncbi:MAG: hypothetical protein M3384_13440 [Acidobacteriota bacterium]|nr:hypothetical protein [Acidobacteriota bacterium]